MSKTDPESVKVLNKFPGLLTGRDEDPDRSVVESLRFGAICFTPHADAPFRGLMQMMMEHFLGKDFPDAYLKKCWICGSEDVDHKLRYTAAGNKKYYHEIHTRASANSIYPCDLYRPQKGGVISPPVERYQFRDRCCSGFQVCHHCR